MTLTKKDFNYHLPTELIAQTPAQPRDHSRLLHFDKQQGQVLSTHQHFFDLPQILAHQTKNHGQKYLIVRNNSAVIPARLFGQKIKTGGQVELLLVKKITESLASQTWECLTKPGLKPKQEISFLLPDLKATCLENNGYTRLIEFKLDSPSSDQLNFYDALHQIGLTPLPPYINSSQDEKDLRQLYQTIYAKQAGSVAAPTAGLHFTSQVEKQLIDQGIQLLEVTLHVGLGTFLTVKEEGDLSHHHMHTETYTLSPLVAQQINQAKAQGYKILAIGTTTARVLESAYNPQTEQLEPQTEAETDIFLYPPRQLHVVDSLLTNFHLPESTLLMLIATLTSTPNTQLEFSNFLDSPIGQAYQTAIDEKFRFFSFGDAMLID